MFIETIRGRLVALRSIYEVGPISGKENRLETRTVYYGEGDNCDTAEVYDYELRNAIKGVRPFIPAQPGTYIIGHFEDFSDVWRSPVIGWALNEYGTADPIVQTSTDVDDQSAVLWPDGTVSSAEDLTCANISAYLAIMKERAEEKKKAAAE